MNRIFAAVAFILLTSGTAFAGLFRVGDLGAMPSRESCMSLAVKVLDEYLDAYGGGSVHGEPKNADSWVAYGWGLRPGENDIIITCPIVGGQVNAFYTLYAINQDAVQEAEMVVQQLRELWSHHY